MKARLASITAIAIVFPAFTALFVPATVSDSPLPQPPVVRTSTVADAPRPEKQQPHDDSEGLVDLYGNEVIDAIATYTLDPAGSLYELHSPQTELPRLGSPKS